MNILLITLSWPKYGEYNLYSDLAQEFTEQGHNVTVATLNENINNQKTYLSHEENMQILRIKSGKIQKRNKYLKVIFSFLAGPKIFFEIRKYFKKQKFDLILFATPPITLSPSVILIKKIYHAKLYLLLKDIWPQDAVDLGEMRKRGFVWIVFRYLEILTYKNSNYIGCMSPANVDYILKNNKYLKNKIIEVCPNSERLRNWEETDKELIKEKYNLPKNKIIFVYGGNLGKAQGVEFLIDVIDFYQEKFQFYFLIIGAGTKYKYLCDEINNKSYTNAKILPWINKSDFVDVIKACDIGLILLNKNSSVPNFPSRLLTYLKAKLPILAAVDRATDIGDIIECAGCGAKANNGDINSFDLAAQKILESENSRVLMGENGYKLFLEKYTTKKSYEIIVKHFKDAQINDIEDIKVNEI